MSSDLLPELIPFLPNSPDKRDLPALAYNLLLTVTRHVTACKMCMRNLGKLVIMFSCQGLLDNSDLRNEETDG